MNNVQLLISIGGLIIIILVASKAFSKPAPITEAHFSGLMKRVEFLEQKNYDLIKKISDLQLENSKLQEIINTWMASDYVDRADKDFQRERARQKAMLASMLDKNKNQRPKKPPTN